MQGPPPLFLGNPVNARDRAENPGCMFKLWGQSQRNRNSATAIPDEVRDRPARRSAFAGAIR
jgi:hypothetical protein